MKYIVRDRNGFVLLVSYSEQQAYEMAATDADSTVEELSEIPDDKGGK